MPAPPDFASFLQLLTRALVHPGLLDQAAHPAFRKALEDSWHGFRHVSEQRHAAGLRLVARSGAASTVVAACGPHPLCDVKTLLPDRAGEEVLARLVGLFQAAQMRALFLLPGLAWDELYQGVLAVFDGRLDLHVEHRLLSRFAHRVMAQGMRPSVEVGRDIPQPVIEALDCLAMVLTGLERFGPGTRISIAQVLDIVAHFLVGELYNPAHARTFLASLDLATGNLPPPVQRGVLNVCAKALPEEMRQPIVQSCMQIVELAGGADALADRADQGGVPLAGYHQAARAIARIAARDRDSESGAKGRSPSAQGPQLRTFSGMYTALEPSPVPPRPGAATTSRMPTNPAGAFPRSGGSQPAIDPRALEGGEPSQKSPGAGYQTRRRQERPPTPEPPEAERAGPPPEVHLRPVRRTHESGVHRLPIGPEAAPAAAPPRPPVTSESAQFFGSGPTEASDSGLGRDVAAPPRDPRPLDDRTPQWLETYARHGGQLMERAQDLADPRKYVGALKILSHVGGWFLDHGQWVEALPVARLLKGQQSEAGGWPEAQKRALADALELVFPPEGSVPLVLAAVDATPADRGPLCELIAHFGLEAVPVLLRVMATRRISGTLRRELTALIEMCGPEAGPIVLEELQRQGARWNRVTGLVALLGAVGYQAAQRTLLELLRHPQPKVREEAALALYKLLEDKASRYLVRALDDPDTSVCQRGLALLGAGGCREAPVLSLIHDLVALDGAQDAREEDLILTAIHAIEDLGNVELADGQDAERSLLAALRDTMGGGFLGLAAARSGRSAAIQAAICRTLGGVGGAKSAAALEQVARQGPVELRDTAMRAMQRLRGQPAGDR